MFYLYNGVYAKEQEIWNLAYTYIWWKIKFNITNRVALWCLWWRNNLRLAITNLKMYKRTMDRCERNRDSRKWRAVPRWRKKFPSGPAATDFRVLRMFTECLPDIEMISSYWFAIEIALLIKEKRIKDRDKRLSQSSQQYSAMTLQRRQGKLSWIAFQNHSVRVAFDRPIRIRETKISLFWLVDQKVLTSRFFGRNL